MLVIISDLHFTDGTTSNLSADGTDLFNISPEAFRLFFGKISSIIERRKESVREVKFVYNGDIFDPLRTCTWFEVPAGHRFWNVPPDRKAIQKTCGGIVARILHHNQEALAWLSGQHPDFEKTWQVDQEVERVYIPGNHDRLMNLSPYCRRQVQLKLLNCKSSARFDNACLDRRHQTLIIHGHEADPFNCEFDPGGNPKYDDTPIGDVLTTALFANIGHQANGLDIPAAAKERFRDIDNVRPNLAVIRYLQDIITDFAISGKVEKMLQTIVEEFNQLAFYQKWSKAHDQWNLGYDEADKLQ
ncbi:MAG: hypothetical protein Q8P24_10330, partial [Desulfobacterales bacterium]|nr:hypothetical protein [Desulfobacterales bacterium]